MSEFLDEVAEDCKDSESDLGSRKMVWKEVTCIVAPSLIRRGSMLVIGGKEVEIKLTLRVRWSGTNDAGVVWEFTTSAMPKAGEKVYYLTKSYRIAQVNDAHGVFMEIDLIDDNR